MLKRFANSRTSFSLAQTNHREQAVPANEIDVHSVETVVVALIPEFHQVKVRDQTGHCYALTRKTQGVDLAALHEGQTVVCTVTRKLPRVLTASAVG